MQKGGVGLFAILLEPVQQTVLKLLRGGADRAAMVRTRHFPENRSWIAFMDAARVTDRDIAVHVTVNQKNWNRAGCDRIFGQDLGQVLVVFPASAEKGELHKGPENSSSEPRPQMEWLPHTVVRDLTKR